MTDDELRKVYAEAVHAYSDENLGASGIDAGLRAVFLAGARAALEEADHTEIERYEGENGRRQWGRYTTTWLYPGDRVWVVHFGEQRVAPLVGGEGK